ncbi:MAG TPA: putative cytokinetic ring protein SteA [Solirubrobacterales bacterium]|nr:putative cytokinetic ring protein SteA [Solirubrobacterales bacterium]
MASPGRTRRRALLRSRDPRRAAPGGAAIEGRARLGRRTKDLVRRIGPGDVAIIDHADIDRIAAEELVATGVGAVVNVSRSSTGRYPNAGPLLLARAGVLLVDAPGAPLFDQLDDGDHVALHGGEVRSNGHALARGRVLEVAELAEQMERQRDRIDEALEAFAENTVAHIRQERDLLSGRFEVPETRTSFRDRHVLIVVRGTTHRRDLRALRAYIADVRPLLVGVDGGADAILEAGLKPDVVLGDMDSASDEALRWGAELIVHAYPDGRAPGRERLDRLGLEHTVIPAPGTSQDVAMLLAFEKGAGLIVSVGAHFNLIEFLDKNRAGMSSTFLTRLRVGETLVDAKGVSRLYNPGIRGPQLALFAAASALLLVIVVLSSPALDNLLELVWLKIRVWLGI